MSIIDKHSEYNSNLAKWARCRAVVEGQDAIHAGKETYLPRIGKQDDDQYDAYRARARFFNASDRTVSGMNGLVFRKDPIVEPEGQAFEDDVSHQGISLDEYASDVLRELLIVGRCGTLVDYPTMTGSKTVAQAEAENATPMWAFYTAENIYDWSFSFINNVYQLTRVMLFDGVDSSGAKEIYNYRELLLEDGVYVQKLYKADDVEADPVLFDTVMPNMNGKALGFIPFIIHGISGRMQKVDKPPLIDLFDTNIKHYQLKADHAHALHYVALPTPYAIGVDSDESPDSIGPQRIWNISNEGASVGILEFSGSGVGAIASELTTIETHMAQLGSRILAPEVNINETATASEIKSMSENSTLSIIAGGTSKQLTKAWQWSLTWMGKQAEAVDAFVELNKAFLPVTLAGSDLLAIVTSWQSGAISKPTMFKNLQRGDVIPDGATYEEEEQKIDEETPEADPFLNDKDDDDE